MDQPPRRWVSRSVDALNCAHLSTADPPTEAAQVSDRYQSVKSCVRGPAHPIPTWIGAWICMVMAFTESKRCLMDR